MKNISTQSEPIQMVDLKSQYHQIKDEIDQAILDVVGSAQFINGPQVGAFCRDLEDYLNVKHVIPCANGTDALQIVMMGLGLQPGDEVIVPAFTYVATAEVIALLRLQPVMVDVDPHTFNVRASDIESHITPRTKAIVPVHLFGQSADMDEIMALADKHNIHVIEDNAQAIGAWYTSANGTKKRAGTIGIAGTTSFFPAKNLGCYGDGGAIFTNDDDLAKQMAQIANHGQNKRYYHAQIGVNSRLDTIQAAVLKVKLKYLDRYAEARNQVAQRYDEAFADISQLQTPARAHNSTHVFHQYTLFVNDGRRDQLVDYLNERGVPANIYYPVPLYKQEAFRHFIPEGFSELPTTELLCNGVMSLPIHTEMKKETQDLIINTVKSFF